MKLKFSNRHRLVSILFVLIMSLYALTLDRPLLIKVPVFLATMFCLYKLIKILKIMIKK